MIQDFLGGSRVLLTTTCTHALEMAALLLDIQPGDEVIVPAFTLSSTANAFLLRGARPVLADISSETLNLDARQVERLMNRRTRAIAPVHYGGSGEGVEALARIAADRGVHLIEDNAQGFGSKQGGHFLGTFGTFGAVSFHATKNITCGEGGALIINDESFLARAETILEKGTNKPDFERGRVERYEWVDAGSSYALSEVLAALLLGQLEALQEIQERRKQIWKFYEERLNDWAVKKGIRLPCVSSQSEPNAHLFYLIFPEPDAAVLFMKHMKSEGVETAGHFQALSVSPQGRRLGFGPGDCPIAENISGRLVRLPVYPDLTLEERERVCEKAVHF